MKKIFIRFVFVFLWLAALVTTVLLMIPFWVATGNNLLENKTFLKVEAYLLNFIKCL